MAGGLQQIYRPQTQQRIYRRLYTPGRSQAPVGLVLRPSVPTKARTTPTERSGEIPPVSYGASAGLLALFQAFAATKRQVTRCPGPSLKAAATPSHSDHGRAPAQPPAATAFELPASNASHASHLPLTAPSTTQGPDGTHFLTVTDALLEAALWMDEVRDLQTYREQIKSEIEQLSGRWTQFKRNPGSSSSGSTTTALANAQASGSQSVTPNPISPSEAFVSHGPEFCPVTCQVEADADIDQLRAALRCQIRALSSQLLANNKDTVHTLRSNSPQQPSVQLQFSDSRPDCCNGVAPPPAAANAVGQRQAKELRKLWSTTAQEVTYLLVQLVQLRQLPAQPKARITFTNVKEQVMNHLRERQAYLAQDTV